MLEKNVKNNHNNFSFTTTTWWCTLKYIYIFIFLKIPPCHDQIIIQYPLFMLNEWQGHCVYNTPCWMKFARVSSTKYPVPRIRHGSQKKLNKSNNRPKPTGSLVPSSSLRVFKKWTGIGFLLFFALVRQWEPEVLLFWKYTKTSGTDGY
jgi:hypothetical protein